MKKVVIWIVAACLGMCAFAQRALAEDEVQLAVDTVAGAVGDTVEVAVNVSNALRLDSIQFRLNYDSEALHLVEAVPSELTESSGILVTNTEADGLVQVAFACAYGLEQNGSILTLRFEIRGENGSAVTASDVLATKVDAELSQYKAYLAIADGGVQVGDAPIPESAATPWIPESPTPEPTATPEATATPEPEEQTPLVSTMSPGGTGLYLVAGIAAAGLLAVIVIALSKKRRKAPPDAVEDLFDTEESLPKPPNSKDAQDRANRK